MADGDSPYRRTRITHGSPMHTSSSSWTSGSRMHQSDVSSSSAFVSDHPALTSGEQNLWDGFESVARSVTDLYCNPTWTAFQRTASATTNFYKGSVEAYRRGSDAGIAIGRQILCKEILHFLQTTGHSLRRDDLVNFILSRAMITNFNETDNSIGSNEINVSAGGGGGGSPMQLQDSTSVLANEPLEIFQEALGTGGRQQTSPNRLTSFFVEEFRRHNPKRRRTSPEHSGDSSPDNGSNPWHTRSSKRCRKS